MIPVRAARMPMFAIPSLPSKNGRRRPLPALLQDGLGLATFISTWPYIHILAIALLLTAMYRLFLYQYGSYQLFRYLREGLG